MPSSPTRPCALPFNLPDFCGVGVLRTGFGDRTGTGEGLLCMFRVCCGSLNAKDEPTTMTIMPPGKATMFIYIYLSFQTHWEFRLEMRRRECHAYSFSVSTRCGQTDIVRRVIDIEIYNFHPRFIFVLYWQLQI